MAKKVIMVNPYTDVIEGEFDSLLEAGYHFSADYVNAKTTSKSISRSVLFGFTAKKKVAL